MLKLKNNIGNEVIIYGDIVEREAIEQIMTLADSEIYLDSKIRIMPDVHAGKDCTIGTTMTIGDKLTPNLVGVDIGCGMFVIPLGEIDLDLELLDHVVFEKIPSGENIHPSPVVKYDDLENLRCLKAVDRFKAESSIGSLGGGNHFIEANEDDEEDKNFKNMRIPAEVSAWLISSIPITVFNERKNYLKRKCRRLKNHIIKFNKL